MSGGALGAIWSLPPPSKGGGGSDPLSSVGKMIAGIEDELTREIYRGVLNKRLSRFGIKIPDPVEQELQQREANIAQIRLYKAEKALQVEMALAAMLDSGDVDESVIERPDEFLQRANSMRLTDITGKPIVLTKGDLVLAEAEGFAAARKVQQQAATAPSEREAERLSRTTSSTKNLIEASGMAKQAAEGTGPLGALVESVRESSEEASGGLNLGTGWGSDIDTAEGSKGLLRYYSALQETMGNTLGKEQVADIFLQQNGANLKDQLEGLSRNEDTGELIVGQGDAGVDDEATFYLTALLGKIARDSGKGIAATNQAIGLEYSGIDTPSFLLSAEMAGKRYGAPGEQVLTEVGFADVARRRETQAFYESLRREASGDG